MNSNSILTQFMYFMLLLTLLCTAPFSHSFSAAEQKNSVNSVYVQSNDPMQDVQKALESAKSENKLVLLVLGAQWCHDSRGLAENFAHEDLAPLLASKYETIFVDVGYYKNLTHITQRFEQANYYVTPTVMIIDPKSERLINAKDMVLWGSADSVALTEYISYFTNYAEKPLPSYQAIPDQHIEAIQQFEAKHAQRLNQAYAVLVPNMIDEDNAKEVSPLFYKQWDEVKAYRISLQKDLQRLRDDAINQAQGTLIFPEYPAFSWE